MEARKHGDDRELAGFPTLGALVTRMQAQLAELREHAGTLAGSSTRPTCAPRRPSGPSSRAGGFLDAAWVERWDVAFAGLLPGRAGRR